MSGTKKAVSRYRKVMRLMELQRRTLADARSDKDILEIYSAILSHLGGFTQSDIIGLLSNLPNGRKVVSGVPATSSRSNSLSKEEIVKLAHLSLDDIESLVVDETTPRKILEAIAVSRFQVPSGSLRSFSNVRSLREKILTRVQNERAHVIIQSVARRTRK